MAQRSKAYQKAAELLPLPGKERIFLIGDHPNDVAAARANQVVSVAVATGLSSAEELAAAGPDLLLRHLGEFSLDPL